MTGIGSREWFRDNAHRVALVVFALVSIGLLLIALTSCANAYDNAQISKGAMSRALGETSLAWLEYDRAHQEAILAREIPKQAKEQLIAQWREDVQRPVVEGFHLAEEAMRELDRALKDWQMGMKEGLSGAMLALQRSLAALTTILKKHQIPIPLPGGVK
jgi:hypothetical protein